MTSLFLTRPWSDLSGVMIGITKGGYTEKLVRSMVPWKLVETYDSFEDLFDAAYRGVLMQHRGMLTKWIGETDDKGRYPEDSPNLQYMLDVWRERGIEPGNPEYDHLKG